MSMSSFSRQSELLAISACTRVNKDRIHDMGSEAVDVFEVIESFSTGDSLIFSLFILHKNRHLSRHVIRLYSSLSIESTTIEEKIFCSRMQFVMGLSPTSFFGYYTDTALSMGTPPKYQRIPFEAPTTASILSTATGGEFIFSATSFGVADMMHVECKAKTNELAVIEEAEIGVRMQIHRSKPTSIALATLRNHHNDNHHGHGDNCCNRFDVLIIGYEDGYISFNCLQSEITTIDLKSGPILSLFVNGSEVYYSTQSGSLGRITVPRYSISSIVSRTYSHKAIVNANSNADVRVYSCSYHFLSKPTTAILVMAESIRLFINPAAEAAGEIVVKEWKRGQFKSGAITVFPPDLYKTDFPRLVVALTTQHAVFVLTVPTSPTEKMSIERMMSEVNVAQWGLNQISAVSLPAVFMMTSPKEKVMVMRMAVITAENDVLIVVMDYDSAGKLKRTIPLCQYSGSKDDPSIGLSGQFFFSFNPYVVGTQLEWIDKRGVVQSLIFFTPGDQNRKKELDIFPYAELSEDEKQIFPRKDTFEAKGTATVCVTICDGEHEDIRRTVIGMLNGDIVVYELVKKEICRLSVSKSAISALSACHIMYGVIGDSPPYHMHKLIWVVSMDKIVSLVLYRNKKMTLIAQEKCSVEGAKGVYCIEDRIRSIFKVVVVGKHVQTLYFQMDTLMPHLKKVEEATLYITNNRVQSELFQCPKDESIMKHHMPIHGKCIVVKED
ncbi:hypothetical protein PFISCL1PPCAC_15757 [Pristionchus fissidentatus]|uniref:Cleavage/polyadenylation specificity factor A subunit N-terminal domain-containing protein n=1 Tax=Pristionchus fissidentatus TaxID=1538716 RepID=A0AAV5W163_9BILA|nr:hypothetical protein PFISCL1PPCAC_15757 [Pristionchus fissidentatus]